MVAQVRVSTDRDKAKNLLRWCRQQNRYEYLQPLLSLVPGKVKPEEIGTTQNELDDLLRVHEVKLCATILRDLTSRPGDYSEITRLIGIMKKWKISYQELHTTPEKLDIYLTKRALSLGKAWLRVLKVGYTDSQSWGFRVKNWLDKGRIKYSDLRITKAKFQEFYDKNHEVIIEECNVAIVGYKDQKDERWLMEPLSKIEEGEVDFDELGVSKTEFLGWLGLTEEEFERGVQEHIKGDIYTLP